METNRIIHGDALEELRKLPSASVDLVLTDPPYKVDQKYGGGVDADNLCGVSSILLVLPEISRVLKPDRFAVVFYDNRILPYLFHATKETNLVYRRQIFLYRRAGIAHRWAGWMTCTDPVCFFVNGYNKPFSVAHKGQVKHDCYIKATMEAENTGHPAQKPLEICEDIVRWCSDANEIVLDPYCGSGTVCVAALREGRKYIGIECEQKNVVLCNERLKSHAAKSKVAGSTSANNRMDAIQVSLNV